MFQVARTQREGIPWGFVTSITRDGVTLTDISVSFDEEIAHKYDWVGKAADGFPKLEGNAEEIMGKNFVIRQAHTVLVWYTLLSVFAQTMLECMWPSAEAVAFAGTGRMMTTVLMSRLAVSSGFFVKRFKHPSTSTMPLGLALWMMPLE